MRKEIQVKIQRHADGEQSDDDASHAGDRTNHTFGEFVVDEHLLQEYQSRPSSEGHVRQGLQLDRRSVAGLEFRLGE
jgi:hypothetical protein